MISLNKESKSDGKGEVALNPVSAHRLYNLCTIARSASEHSNSITIHAENASPSASANEFRNQSYEDEAVRAYLSVYPRTDPRAVTLSHILLQYALN